MKPRNPIRPSASPTPFPLLGVLLLAVCLALPAPSAGAAEAETLRRLLDRYAPAVVSVEAVVRTEMQMGGQGQDEESEVDLVGAVVDPGGLIMIWNSRISSARVAEMMRLMGRDDGGFDLRMTPLSFDVRLPGVDEPVEAFLAASDPQLDLAFLQLAEPPPEPLPHFDLTAADVGEGPTLLGEEVFAVNRLSTSFAHAPFLGVGRVVGELEKPRRAWIVTGDFQSFGLPLFTADGRVVAVLSTVVSSVAAERAAAQMQGGMANMMGGGDGKTMGPIGSFALSAETVARVVERARVRARELAAERAEGAGDSAAENSAAEDTAAENSVAEDSAAEDSAAEDSAVEEGATQQDGDAAEGGDEGASREGPEDSGG